MAEEHDKTERRDARGHDAGKPIGEIDQAMRHAPPGRDKREGGQRVTPPIGEIAQAERKR